MINTIFPPVSQLSKMSRKKRLEIARDVTVYADAIRKAEGIEEMSIFLEKMHKKTHSRGLTENHLKTLLKSHA